MTTIYHNPRCSKSREGLQILEETNEPFEIRKYLDEPLNIHELKALIHLLQISPIDLVRKSEAIWKEDYLGNKLDDEQIIKAMLKHPKLIERPIVVKNNKAVIGRPPSLIKELI
jgi:arsenate reductase